MDNPNPIKYSDLIKPDNSITDLISQMEEAARVYDSTRSKIQAAAQQQAKDMQAVSGATEEQRKAILASAEASEKLLAEYKKLGEEELKVQMEKQRLLAASNEEKMIAKLLVEINNSAEGSYKRLSAQYRLNKIALNEMSEAERKNTEYGRRLEMETKAIYEEMNELQKATGKSVLQVGQYERALGNLVGVDMKYVEVMTDSNKLTEMAHGVFKALVSPIGLVIGVVGGATAAFKLWINAAHDTQATGDALDYEVAAWSNAWDLLKKSIATVDFSIFIRGAIDAMAAGRELKQVLDETFERTNSTKLLRASLAKENAMLEEAARNNTLTYSERLEAAEQYLENMKPIYEQEEETARRVRDAQIENLFSLTNTRKFATEAEREAAKEEFAANIKNYKQNEDLIKQAFAYNKAQREMAQGLEGYYGTTYAAQREVINNTSEAAKAFAGFAAQYKLTNDKQVKAYVDAEVAYRDAQAASYNDQKRIVNLKNQLTAQEARENEAKAKAARDAAAAEKKAAEEAAKAQQKAAEEKAKADEQTRKQVIVDQRNVLNAQLQSIQLQISYTQEGTQEMLDLRIAALKKQEEIEKFENAQLAENLRQSELEIEKKYQAERQRTMANFSTQMAQRELAASQELEAAKNDLVDQNKRQRTLFRLQQEKARLEAILRINETAAEKMTETEVESIRQTIAAIQKESDRLGYNNIWEVLGIGLDPDQQDALDTALGSVRDMLGSVVDSWKEAADAAVRSADKQVEAAQKVLDSEIEARNAGYANNVEMAQKELALSKQNQQKALREKERAQKAEAALDTLMQSSSLITATANIWKAFATMPALAIAAISTMWLSFAASKIKAAQVTKETYGEGTVELLEGGSHASGHDIDLGVKRDGTRRRAEGGEFFAVINKRNSRRYRSVIPDVINSFNNGTFAERYVRSSASMAGYAVSMIGGTDVSGIEKDVRKIREQGDNTRYVDGAGNTIVRYKNLTRKIKP